MSRGLAGPTEGRVAQYVRTLADATALISDLGHDRLVDDLPPALSERLSAPRYRARLERRFIRRTGAVEAAPALFENPVPQLAAMGRAQVNQLILDTGIMCQYAVLRRIVDKSVLADLSDRLGLPLALHDARRATDSPSMDMAREIASPYPPAEDAQSIIDAILRDGMQCWCCWIHGQPESLHRFLDALIPSSGVDGTDVASRMDGKGEKCRPRVCRRRADLFVARLDLVLTEKG